MIFNEQWTYMKSDRFKLFYPNTDIIDYYVSCKSLNDVLTFDLANKKQTDKLSEFLKVENYHYPAEWNFQYVIYFYLANKDGSYKL